ncbi:MAG: [FeFe] hydrogenase H-cluster radical SAM maturase HydG [Candidatus Omnitrophota bacterium]
MNTQDTNLWIKNKIKEDEILKYMKNGKDFIPDEEIETKIDVYKNPDPVWIKEIFDKSLAIETLSPDETAALINVKDKDLLDEMKEVCQKIKKKVYDNRIVTFAPLYMGNLCVNNCLYCGFRKDNNNCQRRVLNIEDVKRETEVLAGDIGHKRLIVVYGEHPETDIDYIASTIKAISGVKVKTKNGWGQIRRANVNAAPLSIEDLKVLKEVGIGTYQVFQETYHHRTYRKLHPQGTLKGHYAWRLYCMHRALEAGVDDVGIGTLFGLYDWRFEVMGLLYHARELEETFGIGPHTISFPRLETAANTPFTESTDHSVSDEEFKKLIMILRLAVPYTGMIITARETALIRRETIVLGCTQTDASTRIGIGAYSDRYNEQEGDRQQFILGDTRSLDEVIGEFADMGYITSFCTAGYRCGRTGECIMDLLRSGQEGKFCKLNAILTFREWLDDFASDETRKKGEKVIKKELDEVKEKNPKIYSQLIDFYKRIENGERDLYF